MPILYSVVTRGQTVLCSGQKGAGNFEEVVRSMLPNIPTQNNARTTYTSHNYLFHVQVDNGLIYMCSSDPDDGKKQPYAFLAQIQSEFERAGLVSRAHFAMEGELNGDFSTTMRQEMERFSKPAAGGGGNENIRQLQDQVDEVRGVMTQNIEKVLQRGENLEDLMDKTTDLEAHSMAFKKTARSVHRKMWWKNTKMMIILICVVMVVILVITLIILFSTGVLPASGGGSDDPATTPAAVKGN